MWHAHARRSRAANMSPQAPRVVDNVVFVSYFGLSTTSMADGLDGRRATRTRSSAPCYKHNWQTTDIHGRKTRTQLAVPVRVLPLRLAQQHQSVRQCPCRWSGGATPDLANENMRRAEGISQACRPNEPHEKWCCQNQSTGDGPCFAKRRRDCSNLSMRNVHMVCIDTSEGPNVVLDHTYAVGCALRLHAPTHQVQTSIASNTDTSDVASPTRTSLQAVWVQRAILQRPVRHLPRRVPWADTAALREATKNESGSRAQRTSWYILGSLAWSSY